MIKCEVVFDGDDITIGNYTIKADDGMVCVYLGETFLDWFNYQEEAVKYCMEQNND